MRTAVLEGPHKFVIREIDIPKPAADEVLIKVVSCGVCYSEMGMWEGTFGEYPKRIGHEVSGTIAALGSGVQELAVGQRATVYIDKHGYSEYVVAKADCVIPFADNVPFDH